MPIGLDKMDDNSDRKKVLLPARYVMAIMGSIGQAIAYGFKTNVSVAIIAMVNHTAIEPNGTNYTVEESSSTCIHDTRPEVNGTIAANDGPFVWNEPLQGIILSAYFWGYLVSQLPAGRVAELFSARWVMSGCVIINAIAAALSPIAAEIHYSLFIAMRIAQGIGGGMTFPALHVMIANWAPTHERNVISSIVYAGGPLGTVISMTMSMLLAESFGWASVFYVEGALSIIWCVGWYFLVQDSPQKQNILITENEKIYIARSLGQGKSLKKEKKLSIPWGQVIRSIPFWAIVVTHFCCNFGWFMLLIELPTFMNQILKFDQNQSAGLSAMPFLCMWIFTMVLSKILANAESKGWITASASRKIATLVASFVPMCCLIGVSYVGCNRPLAVLFITIGVICHGGSYSGFVTNHIDIAPNFAGSLIAVTNSIATIPGLVVPIFVGKLTHGNQTMEAWRTIFFVTVGMYVIEMLAFTLFSTADEQPWNVVKQTDAEMTEYPSEKHETVRLKEHEEI